MARAKPPRLKSPAVVLDGVQFRWPGQHGFGLAIDGLDVAKGERVLLVGPSGSGKSTLLNLVCGIAAPRPGEIRVLGRDVGAMRPNARDRFRAEHLGIVFQMFNLLPYASAVENVLLPLGFAAERRTRAARSGTAKEEALRLLDALGIGRGQAVGLNSSQLSIGQQQRVAVARALIGEPEIIIADEPTSALDHDTQERFLDLLFRQLDGHGATLLMVSHDRQIGKRFDRMLRLEEIARVTAGADA